MPCHVRRGYFLQQSKIGNSCNYKDFAEDSLHVLHVHIYDRVPPGATRSIPISIFGTFLYRHN